MVKFMKEHHIIGCDVITENNNYIAYKLKMDCHVNPNKIVIVPKTVIFQVGQLFDPHFSNLNVLARFSCSDEGIALVHKLLEGQLPSSEGEGLN